jgi:alpha-L-fucosidase
MIVDKEAEVQTEQRLAWWREAKFGMFIHWGLYAIPAGVWQGREIAGIGEWIMRRAEIPVAEYEQLASQFHPIRFDADEWVQVAKDAGMKYLVITSKHHDGFAMFKSRSSSYNIVDATPFGRDPMAELAEACRKHGIRLCFYYSQAQDWHHPDAAGNTWDYNESEKDFARYLEQKAKPQVREILTQYGPIGLIWFDTPVTIMPAQSRELADLVHELQPGCLVNSRVGHDAGDYQSAGDNQIPASVADVPWETPATLNDTWGFKANDHNWKSVGTLIRLLVDIVSKGGNYLLNVGPTAEGVIPEPSVKRLRAVGEWMQVNGEAIYGSKPGPFPAELEWGAITHKPGRLYLHVFEWPKKELVLPGLKSKVEKAFLLADAEKRPLPLNQQGNVLRIGVPTTPPDADVSVIVLDIPGQLEVDTTPVQGSRGVVALEACMAQLHREQGSSLAIGFSGTVEQWRSTGDSLSWDFQLLEPGTFEVELWTVPPRRAPWEGGQVIKVAAAGQELRSPVSEDERGVNPRSPHQRYVVSRCGQLTLTRAGMHTLQLNMEVAGKENKSGLTLRSIRLVPAANA